MRWSNRRVWSAEKLMVVGALAGLVFLVTLIVVARRPAEAGPAAAGPVPVFEPSVSGSPESTSGARPFGKPYAAAASPLPVEPAPARKKHVDGLGEGEPLLSDLLFPVPAVSPLSMADSFHDGRGKRVHHAADILAPRHSEVVAVADGTVARMMESEAGGITLYQWSVDRRFVFYYAHLQGYAAALAEGQPVRRGQTLGYVGSTGNAPPGTPHLHFAITIVDHGDRWWGGRPVNPYQVWR